jgi:predicted DNA-binding ribbon-helix-helix protein
MLRASPASTMPFDGRRQGRYHTGMRRRIELLRSRTEDSLEFAIESMMQDRVDSFFKAEEGLEEIARMLALIEEELGQVQDLTSALRLQSRLEFVEDRFDELDSEVRERPRRRRRRIDLSGFFRAAGGDGGETPRGEIQSPAQAFEVLGLEYGSTLTAVTAAFRQRAKELHPDARSGDRSAEPQLRKIIEAYQFLKEHLSLSQTEPPPHV